jgi:hypothetical protein
MPQEEKELLLRDLCARLPYGCRVFYEYVDELDGKTYGYSVNLNTWCIDELEANKAVIKPYLRPMSSMTEEERNEHFGRTMTIDIVQTSKEVIDWLNKKMFDYRELIEKGLAIAVDEENNPYKE